MLTRVHIHTKSWHIGPGLAAIVTSNFTEAPPVDALRRVGRRPGLVRRWVQALGVGAALVWGAGACTFASDPVSPPDDIGVSSQSIIAGFSADSPEFDAVGGMGLLFDDGSGTQFFDLFCSGALIDEDTVLTAKHCVESVRGSSLGSGVTLVFTLGPDAVNPTRWVEVLDMDVAPGDVGGFTDEGNDLGVLQLAQPVSDVVPMTPVLLSESALGETFFAIGFGVRDNNFSLGLRRMGELVLKTMTGSAFGALLGGFESFFEWYTGLDFPAVCRDPEAIDSEACALARQMLEIYDSVPLEQTSQMVLDGDAQPCFADSGSPLSGLNEEGGYNVYGVTIGGIGSDEQVCDFGAVYQGFSPELMGFVQASQAWVDPCAEVAQGGTCEGTIARRCTSLQEGRRKVIQVDCAIAGLTCQQQDNGHVGCGDNDPDFVPSPPSASRGPHPDFASVGAQVFVSPGDPLPSAAAAIGF